MPPVMKTNNHMSQQS